MADTEIPDEAKKIERRGRPRKKQPESEEPKEKAKRGRPKKKWLKAMTLNTLNAIMLKNGWLIVIVAAAK